MKHKEVSPLLQTHDAVIRTFFCFRKHFEWSWVGREGDSADNTIYSSVDSRGTTDQTAKSWTRTRRDQYQKSRGESGGAFQYIIHSTSPHLRQLPNTFMKWSLDLVWSALVRTRRRILRDYLLICRVCSYQEKEDGIANTFLYSLLFWCHFSCIFKAQHGLLCTSHERNEELEWVTSHTIGHIRTTPTTTHTFYVITHLRFCWYLSLCRTELNWMASWVYNNVYKVLI